MNRRQKIIVSVTGIFIVLLVLLGLTYGYFLTRITGNGNPTSISVTTANLELVYGDGTTSILTSSNPIEPGKFSSSKDFTVTNNGNALTDYAVTLEDFSITYAADTVIDGQQVKAGTVTKMEYPEDMKMEITCVVESDDEDRNGQACGNINGTLPTENSILLTNSIEVDDIHKYVLTLTYVDSGIDQSADMNKTIKGKIDIIDPKSTIDLTGSVTTYQSGDYVEINSTPIKSEIVDGKYKIIGVEPGSHTLNIKYKDANGDVQTRGSETLIIKKGDEESVSGNTITFTDESRIATVDVTESYDLTLNEKITGYNPYQSGTLAYNIISNSMNNKNGTQFVYEPLTTPGKEASSVISYKKTGIEGQRLNYMAISNDYNDYDGKRWYYYETYQADETTGKFTLSGKKSCIYNSTTTDTNGNTVSCADELVGKYLYNGNPYANTYADNHIAEEKTSEYLYKVTSTSSSILNFVSIFNVVDEAERVLVPTKDDYGTSYYYRGSVEDNYVNFAGMCWKIVRIEGDGSVKLILEDAYAECNDNETEVTSEVYTGNWSDGKSYVFGYDSNYKIDFINYTGGLADSFKKFQGTLSKKINDKYIGKSLSDVLKIDEWCYDDKVTTTKTYECDTDEDGINESMCTDEEYAPYTRINKNETPSLYCTGTKLTKFKDNTDMYVGTLTADEMSFAGTTSYSTIYSTYLMNKLSYDDGKIWSSLSPSFNGFNYSIIVSAYILGGEGNMFDWDVYYYGDAYGYHSRPAITLKTGSRISSGEGTQSNPYVVE